MTTRTSPFSSLPWDKGARNYTLIAGPCSAESEEQTLSIAKHLQAQGLRYYRASLWKPRTRPGGFEGVGYSGLPWLQRVQDELGMQVMTEVATTAHIEAILAAGIRHIWIGARTTSSPFAMAELADALQGVEDVSVLVKNPINPDINLWEGALLRLQQAGVQHVGAIHRGFSTYGETYYRNSPIWQIPIELKLRHPELSIIVDPSHIGGKRQLIEPIARTALELHFDGLMIETHTKPDCALSDAEQQILPETLACILERLGRLPDEESSSPELEQWRAQINLIDEQILWLLSERQQVSERIGGYKHERNMCILQPERYRQLMRSRILQGDKLGLDKDFVHDLFSRIHEESVRLQQQQ
ncbi:MAG: bifunctional 3-deoxy-7-phosphoheptulonate synthase/chorismate mutase type II [Porphyromonas sp.]|nr:bifunctional 3-deoxy-7-phosphoheptulonate synthase/chorismate mutase type II [Porphyromonas sp.]